MSTLRTLIDIANGSDDVLLSDLSSATLEAAHTTALEIEYPEVAEMIRDELDFRAIP